MVPKYVYPYKKQNWKNSMAAVKKKDEDLYSRFARIFGTFQLKLFSCLLLGASQSVVMMKDELGWQLLAGRTYLQLFWIRTLTIEVRSWLRCWWVRTPSIFFVSPHNSAPMKELKHRLLWAAARFWYCTLSSCRGSANWCNKFHRS